MRFFLGGRDLEMREIGKLVRETLGKNAVVDKGLGWGARASSYAAEISATDKEGEQPVLVELMIDIELPATTIIVDHHGSRAAGPTSLEQVFALLDLPRKRWTRYFDLVAANDRGHVAGLKSAGATDEEAADIRTADRAAQGISREEEIAGRDALRHARTVAGGAVLLVELPHQRTATVTDLRALDPEFSDRPSQLLVIMPGERAYFGNGDVVGKLDAVFPGGWTGGALPARGFWGHAGPELPSQQELVEFISNLIAVSSHE